MTCVLGSRPWPREFPPSRCLGSHPVASRSQTALRDFRRMAEQPAGAASLQPGPVTIRQPVVSHGVNPVPSTLHLTHTPPPPHIESCFRKITTDHPRTVCNRRPTGIRRDDMEFWSASAISFHRFHQGAENSSKPLQSPNQGRVPLSATGGRAQLGISNPAGNLT